MFPALQKGNYHSNCEEILLRDYWTKAKWECKLKSARLLFLGHSWKCEHLRRPSQPFGPKSDAFMRGAPAPKALQGLNPDRVEHSHKKLTTFRRLPTFWYILLSEPFFLPKILYIFLKVYFIIWCFPTNYSGRAQNYNFCLPVPGPSSAANFAGCKAQPWPL